MRNALSLMLTLGLLLAPNALATNDVAITSFTANKTSVLASEELTLTIQIRNNGPDAAANVNFNFNNSYDLPIYPLSSTATAGWACSSFFLNCYTESMPAGAEATLTYRVVAPPNYSEQPLTITMFGGALQDSNRENNRADLTIAVQNGTRSADLAIAISAPPNPIAVGSQVTITYDVRNNGPSDLNDVRVGLHVPLFGTPITFEGAGWTCTTDVINAACQRASLALNANAPLTARFTATATALPIHSQASVFAAQAHYDLNRANDRAFHTLSIGNAADWSRILIPFTTPEIPGANGSIWRTEITGVVEGTSVPDMVPSGCGPLEDPCGWPPLHREFDAFGEDLALEDAPPHFLYYRNTGSDRVRLVTRVFDATKNETTAGAFVPMARDEDFSAAGFTLLAVPNAPQFRSMLRIYEANGTGGDVEVALYRLYENEPFASHAVRLDSVENQFPATTALLPFYPAIAQLDLGALIPPGESRLRVSVRPLPTELPAPAMQLWGFVSITNNETSHVTVVTP